MKEIKHSAYKSLWIPDHCDDAGVQLYTADNWQQNLFHNILRIIPDSDKGVAIDAGANVGVTTIALRYYFDSVVAFEADPLNYECLEKNTDFLSNVYLHNVALGEDNSEAIFLRKLGNSPYTRRAMHNIDIIHHHGWESFSATTKPLDNMSYPGRVNFIKIDVEGSELPVLRGAINLIETDMPVLLIEIGKDNILRFNPIYKVLLSLKYIFFEKINRDFVFIPRSSMRYIASYFQKQRRDYHIPHMRDR